MRALVIDDSRAMRSLLRRALHCAGFDVEEAVHGRDGLERLGAGGAPPDVVLVDWNMPEMNGLEFVEAVRADGRWADLRVLMVTAETEASQVERALVAGANEYLMKPFTNEALIEKLQGLGIAVS